MGQLKEEEAKLKDMFMMNSYSQQFIKSFQQMRTGEEQDEAVTKDKQPLICILCISGVSEDIRRIYMQYNRRVIFRSGWTLRAILIMVKDNSLLA